VHYLSFGRQWQRWQLRALQLKTRQTMSTVTPSVMSHMPLARWAAKADTRGATRRSMVGRT